MIPFCKIIVKFLTSRNRQSFLLILHTLQTFRPSVFADVSKGITYFYAVFANIITIFSRKQVRKVPIFILSFSFPISWIFVFKRTKNTFCPRCAEICYRHNFKTENIFSLCGFTKEKSDATMSATTDRGAPRGAEIGGEPSPLLPDPGPAGVGSHHRLLKIVTVAFLHRRATFLFR